MSIGLIEENVKKLLQNIQNGECKHDDFIYELLLTYGHRKQSVSRLRSGERNLASKDNQPDHQEVIWKRHVYFKQVHDGELHAEIDRIKNEKLVNTNKIRFVIVTDFDHLLAIDTKTSNSLDIDLKDLTKQFDFFLPWAGMEKAVYQGENPADIKAAEKMAKLFDLIREDNFDDTNKDDTKALHNLNVFLTRLLFCFFAEDTEIFETNQFSLAIQSHTEKDGSNLASYLDRLFQVMNTSPTDRKELPGYLADFPYVNGGLFAEDIPSPNFSPKSRRMLIECGSELDWSGINPDIFGSMIQAVVHPDQRGNMGMHYTSITNIMKVIEPLFLNDLYEELDKAQNSPSKLQKLQLRLSEIKIFDPACGSGNFLIIAYKELRKLEMEVLKRLQEIELEKSGQYFQPFSVIKLSQFYGIELDDFAHEVAILSLWLAEHQMNQDFRTEFGKSPPSLPLKVQGNIWSENATRLDWSKVCEKSGEIYILGNPPYLGYSLQSQQHKQDIKIAFGATSHVSSMDYIACWFIKASVYVSSYPSAKAAFVSTNSICQGEQVASLWSPILAMGVEIAFAHRSFKWSNSAKGNAAVICIVVGIRQKSATEKVLFDDQFKRKVKNINPYLVNSDDILVSKRSKAIADIPAMLRGSGAVDGGHLLLNQVERDDLIQKHPETEKFIFNLVGAYEFINGVKKYCLWIEDDQVSEVMTIDAIKHRLEQVRVSRLTSKKKSTQALASFPHQFGEKRFSRKPSIFIPSVSSERREYIPFGFLSDSDVVVAPNLAIYDPPIYMFSVLSSSMHMSWVRMVAGRLKSDYRYSSALCYNTFPFPEIEDNHKASLNELALECLQVRETYTSQTLAKLYAPDQMPHDLRDVHLRIDRAVDKCFTDRVLDGDEARLEILFKNYSEMTGGHDA
ncbi:DNA methyltransferase [Methylophaga sp.]|uniref:DNA methyltransferase n=1 Tax=Methylophaga sp. TaxID=2024840 RepID=UPI0025FB9090|nr:DNA methyltransferase [Methylophaga sp.]